MPLERGREAVAAMRELMLARQPDAVFPLEVRTVAADDAYLSSNYRTRHDGHLASPACPARDYWAYLRAVDRLLGEFDARVHWGKLHFLTPRAAARALSRAPGVHRASAASSTRTASSSTTTCGRCSHESAQEWPMRAYIGP